MSLSRRVGSGAVFQLSARIGSAAVSFVVTAVVLARVLDPSEYGRFHFWLTTFLLALVLVECGANRAAIRRVSAGEAPLAPTLAAAVRLRTIVAVAAFVILVLVALRVEETAETTAWIVLASTHVLTHGWGAGSIPFEARVDFKTTALGVAIAGLVFLVGGTGLAACGIARAEPYLVAYGAGLAAQNAWIFVRARRALAAEPAGGAVSVLDLAREAAPLGLSALAIAIYYYSDTLLLRPLRGEEDVARYAVAYRLMTFALMVPVLGSQVFFPVFSRCAAKSDELLGKAVERATFYFAYLAAAAAATLLVLAEPILGLVFGDRYRDSATVLRVLALAMVVVYFAYPHTTALIASGRGAAFTKLTLSAAGLNVLANLIAIPRYGPVGAAATTLLTEAWVCLGGVWLLRRERRVIGFSRKLVAPFSVLVVTAGVLMSLRERLPLPALLAIGVAIPALLARPLRAWPFDLEVEERELA